MIALNLPQIKDFMNKLLCTETFDHFLLKEATIQSNVTWAVDGTINRDFYSDEDFEQLKDTLDAFLPFAQIRPHCFDLIKGKRTPTYFKFEFLLSSTNVARTLSNMQSSFSPEQISGLFINLKFSQNKLLLTTGVSYRIFSTDKSLEREWDTLVKRFLKNHEIIFEEL